MRGQGERRKRKKYEQKFLKHKRHVFSEKSKIIARQMYRKKKKNHYNIKAGCEISLEKKKRKLNRVECRIRMHARKRWVMDEVIRALFFLFDDLLTARRSVLPDDNENNSE